MPTKFIFLFIQITSHSHSIDLIHPKDQILSKGFFSNTPKQELGFPRIPPLIAQVFLKEFI